MVKREISIIGVPSDYGQHRRGVDMGPSAMRYAGIKDRLEGLGYKVYDEGDILIRKEALNDSGNEKLLNLKEVVEVSTQLASKINRVIEKNRFPLILGGDHSIAIGSLASLGNYYKNLGVIWYDAHADLNTADTTPSGNIHGMPLAISMGIGDERLVNIFGFTPKVKPENIIIIGARSIDPGERELIKRKGIKVYTMHEIDRLGMSKVMDESISYLKEHKVEGAHLSVDLDAIDPLYTPGVGTPVAGGITYRESHLAMEMLEEVGFITSAEFVEVNPILDERNKTADVAVALMGSLFGEKLV